MSVEGSLPDASSGWHGRWVILRGTDELATLRGQGRWWGPGAPDVGVWGDIYYGGKIHFEPWAAPIPWNSCALCLVTAS